MDQYLVKATSLFSDWQQSAINDTRYSVVLIVLTAVICGLIGFYYFKIKFSGLQRQLAQANEDREQVGQQRDELLSVQQQNEQSIADNERQLQQLSDQLEESKQQQDKDLTENQAEISALQSQLNEKVDLMEKQRLKLEDQQSQLSQQLADKKLIADIEKESGELTEGLNSLKQQLQQKETELFVKNEQLERYEKLEQIAEKNAGRVADLEKQLEELQAAHDAELIQKQSAGLENGIKQLEQEKLKAETQTERSVALEDRIQQYDQQLVQLNEKLISLLSPQQSENYQDERNKTDLWMNHQALIDRLIEQLNQPAVGITQRLDSTENDDHTAIINALKEQISGQQNHIARLQYDLEMKTQLKDRSSENLHPQLSIREHQLAEVNSDEAREEKTVDNNLNIISHTLSEKLEDVSKTMDQFQGKLKGLYNKIVH